MEIILGDLQLGVLLFESRTSFLFVCFCFFAVHGPLTVVASPVAEQQAPDAQAQRLWLTGAAACGIFPDRGTNPCPLHRQADSQPLRHQGSAECVFLILEFLGWYLRNVFQHVY